jgi:uncharacterized protein (DUF983 family)
MNARPKVEGVSQPQRPSRFMAILRQLCPHCFQGKISAKGLGMHRACPVCGYPFVREKGFFLGAMYISYMLVLPPLAGITLLLWLFVLPDWPLWGIVALSLGVFLLFVPGIVRYSRALYIHLEQLIEEGRTPR